MLSHVNYVILSAAKNPCIRLTLVPTNSHKARPRRGIKYEVMQVPPLFADDRLVQVHRGLLAFYGQPPERSPWNPLKQFIYSLLSSRTKTEITYEVVAHLED